MFKVYLPLICLAIVNVAKAESSCSDGMNFNSHREALETCGHDFPAIGHNLREQNGEDYRSGYILTDASDLAEAYCFTGDPLKIPDSERPFNPQSAFDVNDQYLESTHVERIYDSKNDIAMFDYAVEKRKIKTEHNLEVQEMTDRIIKVYTTIKVVEKKPAEIKKYRTVLSRCSNLK
ncbi:MAG: hypothetical protein AB7I27_15255 [Bacteriovoracaceae bacterium]